MSRGDGTGQSYRRGECGTDERADRRAMLNYAYDTGGDDGLQKEEKDHCPVLMRQG